MARDEQPVPPAVESGSEGAWLIHAARALALIALVAVVAYLQPVSDGRWLIVGLAVLVLAAPLAMRSTAARLQALVCVLVWTGGGVLGGYFFGTPVFYAGAILAALLLVDVVARRLGVGSRSSARRSSDATQ